MPRKLKKPVTSVTVVRMIEDDCAGSSFIVPNNAKRSGAGPRARRLT